MKTVNEILSNVAAQLGELGEDYLVMLRPSPRENGVRGIVWRSSDPTWACGAARRYVNAVEQEQKLRQITDYQKGD